MTEPTLGRFYETEFQIRDLGGEQGRTLYGVVVPYGEVATVDDGAGPYRERFAPGAFARSIEERGHKVTLRTQHNRSLFPLGKATRFEESDEGLRGEFRVSDTQAGNDALTLVRDGVVNKFSVGFRGITQKRDGDVVVRTEAALHEVSLVSDPAYSMADVAGIRAKDQILDFASALDEWLSEVDLLEHLRALEPERLALLRSAVESLAPQGMTPTPDDASPTGHGTSINRFHVIADVEKLRSFLNG